MTMKPATCGVLLLSTVCLLSACSKPEPKEAPLRAVKVVTVGADALQSVPEFSGEVRARVESRLGFRVGGKIIRRQAELGQRVRAGEVLAQLDPQDYQLSVDAAKAQLAAAATNRDLAAADFRRYKELREQNFISAAELERREATLKAAQAQFDQAQAQLSGQGNQARYTTLVADVAGVVTAVDGEAGQVVAAGAPVIRIAQDGPRDAVFVVPEDKVQALHVGTVADVKLWASQTTVKGRVREVAASADPVTRTFSVKVSLDTKDVWPLGATVSVAMQAMHAMAPSAGKAMHLPLSALLKEGDKSNVWVLDTQTMTVALQPITVATVDGNEVVVGAGLQSGMQVVTAGVHVLSPGQKVVLYRPRQPDAGASAQPVAAK